MLTGIHHVGYVFGELEPHVAFYRERLGLEPTAHVDATEQMGIELVVYRLGDGSSGLELIKPTREEGPFGSSYSVPAAVCTTWPTDGCRAYRSSR